MWDLIILIVNQYSSCYFHFLLQMERSVGLPEEGITRLNIMVLDMTTKFICDICKNEH